MSTDYMMRCRDCLVQSESIGAVGYSYAKKLWEIDKLRDFLFGHEGHNIAFLSEHTIINDDDADGHPIYTEVDGSPLFDA